MLLLMSAHSIGIVSTPSMCRAAGICMRRAYFIIILNMHAPGGAHRTPYGRIRVSAVSYVPAGSSAVRGTGHPADACTDLSAAVNLSLLAGWVALAGARADKEIGNRT